MAKSTACLVAWAPLLWLWSGCGSDSGSSPAQQPALPAVIPTSTVPSPTEGIAPAAPQPATNASAPAAVPSSAPPAGQPSMPAPSNAASPMMPAPVDPTKLDHTQDIRGHCGLNTGFADDHACLIPPRPNEGFQIHVGPKNYDDPAEIAKFVMKPGEESSECFTFRTTNTEKIIYQSFTLSGRAGTHHIIASTYSGELPEDTWGNCGGVESADITNPNVPMQTGNLPTATKSYMPRGKVAPEYAHVGRVIEAKTLVQSDMHYYNFTDKDILREYWMNVYYPAPDQKVTEYADTLVGFGGTGWREMTPIAPGTDMVYKYECPFTGDGHLLQVYGHYHAHGKRFTSSIKRANGQIEKIFEMFDYADPAIFDYNSVTVNPTFSDNAAGAVSGPIAITTGDILQWECHIINDSDVGLTFTNEVKTGEMCNIWGATVGNDPFRCFMP
jgi:hypothetical protein